MAIHCDAAMTLCNAALKTCQCYQGTADKCGRCPEAQLFALTGGLLQLSNNGAFSQSIGNRTGSMPEAQYPSDSVQQPPTE